LLQLLLDSDKISLANWFSFYHDMQYMYVALMPHHFLIYQLTRKERMLHHQPCLTSTDTCQLYICGYSLMHHFVFKSESTFLFAPERSEKYCDECVCLSFCLSVYLSTQLTYLRYHMSKLKAFLCMCPGLLWQQYDTSHTRKEVTPNDSL